MFLSFLLHIPCFLSILLDRQIGKSSSEDVNYELEPPVFFLLNTPLSDLLAKLFRILFNSDHLILQEPSIIHYKKTKSKIFEYPFPRLLSQLENSSF